MTNPHYNVTNNPATLSRGRSVVIRDEYALIEDGFDNVEVELQARVTVVNPTSTGTLTHTGPAAVFTGTTQVLVPTVTPAGDNSTKAASTAFVQNAIGSLPGVVPPQVGNSGCVLAVNDADAIYWAPGGVAAISFALLAQGVI